ncbi:Cornifelin B, variant 2 [Clonorchis sinensis]|uniref:Cornifelin B, variant 2 n=2 Tax=Clonorchis sinensis TaxID=79923 RepID=A0A8T1M396_CLOSI|nr:Cornifelin B, variant 2 [Clonorchis sinensis]
MWVVIIRYTAQCKYNYHIKWVYADEATGFLTAFCYTCMTCYLYEKYGEGCLTPCIIPMSAMVLTVQHRNRNGIRGSILEDCLTHAFCSPCAICRLYRDMKFVEEIRGTLN